MNETIIILLGIAFLVKFHKNSRFLIFSTFNWIFTIIDIKPLLLPNWSAKSIYSENNELAIIKFDIHFIDISHVYEKTITFHRFDGKHECSLFFHYRVHQSLWKLSDKQAALNNESNLIAL